MKLLIVLQSFLGSEVTGIITFGSENLTDWPLIELVYIDKFLPSLGHRVSFTVIPPKAKVGTKMCMSSCLLSVSEFVTSTIFVLSWDEFVQQN